MKKFWKRKKHVTGVCLACDWTIALPYRGEMISTDLVDHVLGELREHGEVCKGAWRWAA